MGRLKTRSSARGDSQPTQSLGRMTFHPKYIGALVEFDTVILHDEYGETTTACVIRDCDNWEDYIEDAAFGWSIEEDTIVDIPTGTRGLIVDTGFDQTKGYGLRYYKVLLAGSCHSGCVWCSPDLLRLVAESPGQTP